MKKWSLHLCGKLSLDSVCRDHGCARIHLHTPWYSAALALTPDARFAHKLDKPPMWGYIEKNKVR